MQVWGQKCSGKSKYFRRAAINFIKQLKAITGSKQAISGIMLDCLIDHRMLLRIVGEN